MGPDNERKYPSGVFGFLARLRDSGAMQKMPAGWAKVLLALYSHRNPQGYAWPSQRTLAEEAGVDKRTVKRFVSWAKASLGVRVVRKHCNSYYLPLDERVDPWMPASFKKASKGTAQHPKERKAQIERNYNFR